MALKWPDKDPEAFKDYGLDWSALLAVGETVQTSTWTATPTGLTLSNDAIVGAVAVTWIAGGAEGITYKVVNTMTTSLGLIDERTISIKVKTQ